MKTKQNWLVWLAPLVAAVPPALTHCGGSTSTPGETPGLDGGGGDTSVSGSSSGSTSSGSTSGTTTTSGAGGSGATSGTGGTGATTGAGSGATTGASTTGAASGAGGTGATTGASTTGASSGAATSGAADPCTDGTYKCNAAQKCDPNLGCVQCLTNANCPPGGAGNANLKVCVLGNCAVCGADTDCPTGDVCYPSNHTCHASCLADGGAACGGGRTPICDMTTGACVGCLTADDCKNTAGRAVCDATTQQCVQCQADADCKGNPAGAVCDTASATCVQCEANSDCPTARPVCDADFHTCVAGCTTDAQCLARSRLTPVCDTTTGRCEAEPACTSNADCSADGGGATPFCEAPRCVECIVTTDCPGTGRTCANGICR